MRTLWCTLILGWRNVGIACPERDANPMLHTQSGLAEPRLCTPRTRGGPYDAHSFWVGETEVLQPQSERRTLCCTLILRWRNLGFAVPERDSSPMAHAHSGLAQLALRTPRTRSELDGAHTIWVGEPYFVLHSQNEMRALCCTLILRWANRSVAFPERNASPMAHPHSRLAKPAVGVPRSRGEPYGAHSIWVGEAFGIPRRRGEAKGAHSLWVGET